MTGSPVQPLNTCTVDAEEEHNEELMGLTAGAADPEDDEGLPDPLLEQRIAAAADLARREERIRVAAMGALRRWTDLVRAAVLGEDTLTAAASEVPPDANAIPPLSAQWSTILTDTVDAELTAMLGEVFAGILGEETTVSARPWQESYIAEVHNRLTGVADQTFDLIRGVIADGQATGADIPTLRGLISDVLATRGESTWAGRAQTIARTEAVSAMNGGQLQAWKVQAAETGEVREKAFLATIDRRTRRSHWRADGQRVALDAKFVVGHAQLDHPGDPRGPAEETVNCRCAMLILDADEELPDTADRQLRPAGEVQAEIDRRAADGDLRASDDPDAAAGPRAPRTQEAAPAGRPAAGPSPEPVEEPDPMEAFRRQLLNHQEFGELPHDSHRFAEVGATRMNEVTADLEPLTEAQNKAVADYTSGTYVAVNNQLRRGMPLDDVYSAPDIQAAMRPMPLDVVSQRGTSFAGLGVSGVEELQQAVGSTFTELGFSSTAVGGEGQFGGDLLLHVQVPEGMPAVWADQVGNFAGQNELILPAGTRYDILQVVTENGTRPVVTIRAQLPSETAAGSEAEVTLAEVTLPDDVNAAAVDVFGWASDLDVTDRAEAAQLVSDLTRGGEFESAARERLLALKRKALGSTDGPAGVTAAATPKETTMPRKWVSDPYLAPFDEASGDGRIIKPGSLHARELPLPLLFQESSGFGHEGSVVVGKIDEAGFADGGITAAGQYLDDPSVAEAVGKATALAESGLGHVSVDLGAVTAELVDEDGNPVDWDDLFDAWEDGTDIAVLEQVTDGELIAVTQVATPAFSSAKIRLAEVVAALIDTAGTDIGIGDTVDVATEDAGTIRGRVTAVDEGSATVSVQPIDAAGGDAGDVLQVAPGAVTVVIDVDEPTEPAPAPTPATAGLVFAVDAAGAEIAVGDAVLTDLTDTAGEVVEAGVEGAVTGVIEADGDTPAMVTVARSDGGAAVSVPAAQVTVTAKAEPAPAPEPAAAALADQVPALVAGAGPLRPIKEWFDRQPLTGPTAMTITEEGQIFGHVAQWGQCHVGFANTCWTAPESATGYAYFHVGEVVCADGSHVAVGNLTLGPRHADERLGYRAAIEHYDSAAAGVGVVRCYEDEFGIQFAGALTPGVSEEQLYDMRRCPVSGDWRKIGGQLDLIGVLSVNSGGYPTPRFSTDDAGRTALVAAPGVPVPALEAARGRRSRSGGLSQRQVMDRLKAELRTELAAEQGRRRRLASVAATIRRDPRSRLAAAAERVHQ